MSLNVSPRQLLTRGFAARVLQQIGRHDLPVSRFMIELTESAWTVDAAETLAVTADLRVGGVALAIDDFGAGYTSLSRFRELDFDVVKLDRRLLVDIPADHTAMAVLRAILDLAQACGASIIAQGIETPEQLEYVAASDISLAEGFLLGLPLPAAELTPMLTERLVEGRAAA
jgi:EAL domain-containing protein (putative c-di-GMP-specific phosphodiesterase class I)